MTPEKETTDALLKEKYKSNSYASKVPVAEEEKEKHVTKIVTGKVISREKTLGKKFAEMFCGEDMSSVGKYIVQEVIVPAIQNTIVDVVKGGIEMLIFPGEIRPNTRRTGLGQQSKTSYSSISNNRPEARRAPLSLSRPKQNINNIILASRGEVEEVLSMLSDLVIDYDVATVADLYGMVGIDTSFTDNKYGWTDLRSATYHHVREGYMLDLPKAMPLD